MAKEKDTPTDEENKKEPEKDEMNSGPFAKY